MVLKSPTLLTATNIGDSAELDDKLQDSLTGLSMEPAYVAFWDLYYLGLPDEDIPGPDSGVLATQNVRVWWACPHTSV